MGFIIILHVCIMMFDLFGGITEQAEGDNDQMH